MADLVDRQYAINILQKIKKKRAECGCKGSSYEARALEYAIETLKQVPAWSTDDEEDS